MRRPRARPGVSCVKCSSASPREIGHAPGPATTMVAMSKERRPLPPWLLGLIIAAGVFLIVLLAINLLGFGDDPVIGGLAKPAP